MPPELCFPRSHRSGRSLCVAPSEGAGGGAGGAVLVLVVVLAVVELAVAVAVAVAIARFLSRALRGWLLIGWFGWELGSPSTRPRVHAGC
eukprot:COSAG02_NODE_3886_length_6086_cov_3.247211_3_plen_90_part_00